MDSSSPGPHLNNEEDSSTLNCDSHLQKSESSRSRVDRDGNRRWWFASTLIPLLAAFTGPIANLMSIVALVTYWRNNFSPAAPGNDADSVGFPDPPWCIVLKAVSLACGVTANIFLLLNFTRRIRYIVALPITIILWYLAAGILAGALIAVNKHIPPHSPDQTYSQGFFSAIIGATLYTISSMVLCVNMLGYFLGHYPQHFDLTDEHRNMILQTIMFCLWLSGGAGIYHRVDGLSYANALYFCDVTILTIGFGDFRPTTEAARGILFPYAAGGIIILGLLISSIRNFVRDVSHDVIRRHVARQAKDIRAQNTKKHRKHGHSSQPPEVPCGIRHIHSTENSSRTGHHSDHVTLTGARTLDIKDRFAALRTVQRRTRRFTHYFTLALSVVAFCIVWFVGAIVFWRMERTQQHWTYPNALYFCYVALLTIGFGDFTPTSNSGKPFFVVWSLVAVPTMTILISHMGETVIAGYKRGGLMLAAWSTLPEAVRRHGHVGGAANRSRKSGTESISTQSRLDGNGHHTVQSPGTDEVDTHDLAVRLAVAIQKIVLDLDAVPPKTYGFDEWNEYSKLLRFTYSSEEEFQQEGVLEWAKLAERRETEWLLKRLTESLVRYFAMERTERLTEQRYKELESIPLEMEPDSSHQL